MQWLLLFQEVHEKVLQGVVVLFQSLGEGGLYTSGLALQPKVLEYTL